MRSRIRDLAHILTLTTALLVSACGGSGGDGGGGGGGGSGATPAALISSGTSEANQGNLQVALGSFQSAAAHPQATPEQVAEAQLYIALLKLGLSVDAEGTSPAAVAFHDLMAGFGLPAAGPDVLALSDYFAQLPDPLPEGAPNQAQVREYVRSHLISAIETAEVELAVLPPTVHSFFDTVTAGIFEIDFTDVLAARALLELAASQLHFAAAYGGSVDIDAATQDDDIDPNAELLADPTFLVLEDASELILSQDSMRRAIELYDLALATLQAEADDQSDDLVIFVGDTPEEVAQSQQDAQAIALLLDQVHAAIVAPPGNIALENGFPLMLDLGAAFTSLDLRNELPDFQDSFVYSALATLEAPVLNGIFPNLSGLQANKALRLLVPLPGGHAIQVLPGAIELDDDTTTDWGIVPVATLDPTGPEDFTADLGQAPSPAIDIGAIFLAQENTHTPTVDRYFFRIDLAEGEPDAAVNGYGFSLVPNDEGSTVPGFVGTIADNGGVFELSIARADTGEVVVGPDAALVQGGLLFLELGFTKGFLVDAGVANGTEYALTLRTAHVDTVSGDELGDETMPIRFSIDL